MIKAGIIGATGYAGLELLRLLLRHPSVEIAALSSKSYEGKKISDIYPNLYGIEDRILLSQSEAVKNCDVVFAALPHGLSEEIALECEQLSVVFIDIGADFRLSNEVEYEKWYGKKFDHPEIHGSSVYALPELNRKAIASSRLIANPGCYPTVSALSLYPALAQMLVEPSGIVIDAKSGVSGAGRTLSQTTHFPDLNEGFGPYKIAAHRHTPEIEQTLSAMAGEKIALTFVPHLLPINRGIIATIYTMGRGATLKEIHGAYSAFYENEPFVRVLPPGETANLKNVKLSNYCDISLHEDLHTGRIIITGAIDNMVKGAAGQAIQNMNIVFGLDETAGLMMIPPAF